MARTRSVESIKREIEELKRKEAALKAEAKEAERRSEEHRMQLIASAVLRHAKENEAFGAELSRLLSERVRSEADRELLGLQPVGGETAQPEEGDGAAGSSGTPGQPSGSGTL
jgi:hypothetical protein